MHCSKLLVLGSLCLLALILGVGCGSSENDGAAGGGAPVTASDATSAAGSDGLPAQKQGRPAAGGAGAPMTLRLYSTPSGFPLPFHTYYPADMLAQFITSGEEVTVRFTANPGGQMTNDAMLEFHLFPLTLPLEDARVRVREVAEGQRGAREQAAQFPWSLVEYGFSGDNLAGTYALGEHAGRFFYLVVARPPALAEAFQPYVETILQEWRWKDTGTGLGARGR